MTPQALAATHAAAFGADDAWPAEDFARYLADPKVTIHGDAGCFAVIRRIGDEAEVLTLATHPDRQGQGAATAMLATALAEEAARGVRTLFLDVAADNAPAIALYARAGFTPFSERRNYYRNAVTALCLHRRL
ncbi:MAG: ribosomal-protein-alanine N-acetyltransferase RimI [Rhodobacteraceae bacterium HLUCCA08]|nr:MAG: ribosomal-protein-alanine N-acetyltransferase RimI [Rhodobacteraceae bacterium HLUCCA08]